MSTQPTEQARVPADTFELRLLIARMHAGRLTTEQAGELVGVSGQTWRNWEAGYSIGAQKPAMLAYIAKQLRVDEKWLRDGGPLRAPRPPGGGGAVGGEAAVTLAHGEPYAAMYHLRAA